MDIYSSWFEALVREDLLIGFLDHRPDLLNVNHVVGRGPFDKEKLDIELFLRRSTFNCQAFPAFENCLIIADVELPHCSLLPEIEPLSVRRDEGHDFVLLWPLLPIVDLSDSNRVR